MSDCKISDPTYAHHFPTTLQDISTKPLSAVAESDAALQDDTGPGEGRPHVLHLHDQDQLQQVRQRRQPAGRRRLTATAIPNLAAQRCPPPHAFRGAAGFLHSFSKCRLWERNYQLIPCFRASHKDDLECVQNFCFYLAWQLTARPVSLEHA